MEDYVIHDRAKQGWLIALASIAVFMFCIDYSLVNISLPSIAKYFNATIAHVSMLPLAYLLVVTSTVLLFGKLGDILGFKKIFITGMVIFVTGTFLCSIAPTMNILLGLRVYQCIGEAMFSPMAIALVMIFLPPSIRGRALGLMATAQGLGFCLGSLFGGYINNYLGWQGVFYVNIPIGIFMIILAMKAIPSKQQRAGDTRIDYVGAILAFVSLSSLVYAITSISSLGIRDHSVVSCLAVSVITLALFIWQEIRTPNPILHMPLFLNRDFFFATASAFCVVMVYMGLILLLPFYLNMVHGMSIMSAGLMLMVPSAMVMVSAPIAGIASDRFGSRIICALGVALTTLSFFIFSLLTPSSPTHSIIPSLVLAGIAIGCFLPANNKLVMMQAPSDKQGMASAVYKILNSTGGVFGVAILPLILIKKVYSTAASMHIDMALARRNPEILSAGFDEAFKFGMLVCIAGLVFTVLARDKKA